MAIRRGVLDAAEGMERLRLAATLGVRGVAPATLWQGALARAVVHQYPAYDTLFVELAVRHHRPLATFDERLLALFAQVAQRPGALVEEADPRH